MRFLVPFNTPDLRFGILMNSHLGNILRAGRIWAADNQCFNNNFSEDAFLGMLDKLKLYRPWCLFVVVPDVLGDAEATMRLYGDWYAKLIGWPLAFVAQDGQEKQQYPDDFDALFIGGSTSWKLGSGAIECIQEAQKKKHIHIGRVNYWRRYEHFASLKGSEHFTCDGTRQRFEGREAALRAWADYMERPITPYLPVFDCDSLG